MATSIDGYIARKNGDIDWLNKLGGPGEDYDFNSLLSSIDCILMGRNTYDTVLSTGQWPYTKPLFVCTNRELAAPPLHGEQVISGPIRSVLETLRCNGMGDVYVDGGNLVQQCLAEGLIDELTLTYVPVILGSGIRLFSEINKELWLNLVSTKQFPSGLSQSVFHRSQ